VEKMKTQLEFYMAEISKRVERLYEMAVHAFTEAMKAFFDLDQELAASVRKIGDDVDELSYKIEGDIFETIARRQPVAKDLRTLANYLHVTHSLYRIGRFAYKITHIVRLCKDLEHFKEMESLPYLTELVKNTLAISMKALLEGDLSEINELEKMEAESDRETVEMFEEISDYLRKRTDIMPMAMFYIIVGRYCERAVDHAFSIAERAVYIHTGERKQLGLAFKKIDGPH
jgi:phosphate transport system protein